MNAQDQRCVVVDIEALFSRFREAFERSVSPAPAVAPAEPEPWLTIADGAAYAAVSEDTLREWIRLGQLPCGRAGRVLRVRRSSIDALLLSGVTDSPQSAEPANERAAEIVRGLAR